MAPLPGGTIHGISDAEIVVWLKAWLEPEVLVPILATIVVLIVGIVVICVTLARRHQPQRLRGQKDVYCMYTVAWQSQLFLILSTSLIFQEFKFHIQFLYKINLHNDITINLFHTSNLTICLTIYQNHHNITNNKAMHLLYVLIC